MSALDDALPTAARFKFQIPMRGNELFFRQLLQALVGSFKSP